LNIFSNIALGWLKVC